MKRPRGEVPHENISIDEIEVEDKPRKWNKNHIKGLAHEIEDSKGIYYPVIVARIPGKNLVPYFMKDGWGRKRLEAVTSLGWDKIPAVIIPHFETDSDKITEEFVKIIEAKLKGEITDYEIAKAADHFERTYQISASEFGRIMGISMGYCYNLIRRYNNVPDEVRKAWRDQDPLISQDALEKMSHMSVPEALKYWNKRIDIRANPTPLNPSERKRQLIGESKAGKPRRASEAKLMELATAVDKAPLKGSVKDLVMNVIRFSLGNVSNVPGITDYTRLSSEVLDKHADKKSA